MATPQPTDPAKPSAKLDPDEEQRLRGILQQTTDRAAKAMDRLSLPLATKRKATERRPCVSQVCRECGLGFEARRPNTEFCSATCRRVFNNRRLLRGGQFYDLVMEWRHRRNAAAGAQSLLCRMAAAFKAQDNRERAGRPSWNDVDHVRARNAHLAATIVGENVAGNRRRSGGAKK